MASPSPDQIPSGDPWYSKWYTELKFWFVEGWRAGHAFAFIQVLISICAGLAIVFFVFRLEPVTAFVGSVVTIGLAICIVLFFAVARKGGPNTFLGKAVYTFIAAMFVATIFMLWCWFFFEKPESVGRFFATVKNEPFAELPEKIPHLTCRTDHDPRLSNALFNGSADKPRQWMDTFEYGARKQLGDDNCESFWILSDEFPGRYPKMTAFVYVGTEDEVVIHSFLLEKGDPFALTPLEPSRSQGQGSAPKGEYRFVIPASKKGNRLLLYLGLSTTSYSKIKDHDPKFHLRTKPL